MLSRATALEALVADPFDVVVVGGGITGAGVALDAASRGYSVALVEKADYASGTSSRSSKLVHGGLRYLQQFDLGLVREALTERGLMVQLAPHLVRPLGFVVPAFDGKALDRAIGVGLNMYDVMAVERRSRRRGRRRLARGQREPAAAWSPERHRTISGEEVAELIPAIAGRNPTSGYLLYDCQTDDARLVLTVLGEAERFGAVCANWLEVVELLEHDGRAAGVRVRDGDSDATLEVRADNVINATGVWADRIRPAELHGEAEVPGFRPSRGSHLVFDRETLPVEAGVTYKGRDGRGLFAVPWLGSTLVGTTDNDYDGDIDHVRPDGEDLDYLLESVNRLCGTELTVDDAIGAYAGVRPLIATGDPKKSVDISRREELYETSSGMLTITGGKLTTWRAMAEQVVDRLVERDGLEAPCRTREIPLGLAIEAGDLPRVEGVPDDAYEALAGRYGYAAHRVLEVAAERGELAQPILPGRPDLIAEAVFALRHEQARSLADVLMRRTRLGLLAGRELCDPDRSATSRVARAMGDELGWDAARVASELDGFGTIAEVEGLVPQRSDRPTSVR